MSSFDDPSCIIFFGYHAEKLTDTRTNGRKNPRLPMAG